MKKIIKYLIIPILIISLSFDYFRTNNINNNDENYIYSDNLSYSNNNDEKYLEEYNNCLNSIYNEYDNTPYLDALEEKLTSYLENYNVSVAFKDINTGYSYSYNSDKNYYAASTIKMLDAIYIYLNAYNGNLNLDAEVTYLAKHKMGSSLKMKDYKIGDKVSLRKLVEYAITVSDNTAHNMLVDYIGKNTLKEFGQSLGATTTLVGNDIFGTINNHDSMIYLETLNNLINNSGELGEELKSYFVNSDQNYLNFPNEGISASQKYGEYNSYYHANGIVYTENPYVVSILTLHGYDDFEKVIRNINTEIYNLQKEFYENRKNVCYAKVYNQNGLAS